MAPALTVGPMSFSRITLALLLPVALLGADVRAGDPCEPTADASFQTADTLKALLGMSPRVISPELKKARAAVCEVVEGGITVCDMEYDTKEMKFDCDDFAWCFDQECKAQGIDCWQANLGGRGYWPWDDWNAHGVNVMRIELPDDPADKVRWGLVEPQYTRDKDGDGKPDPGVDPAHVVTTWLQNPDEAPQLPKANYPDIEAYYPFFDQWHQAVYIFEDGHSTKAGEAPFTDHPEKVRLYKKLTGNDPSTYDSTPTDGSWQK